MNKKIIILSLFALGMISLSACSTQYNENESDLSGENLSTLETDDQSEEDSFVLGTDDQPGVYESGEYTENGLYFFSEEYSNADGDKYINLLFEDAATGETVYVCTAPGCKHDEEGCTAYFSSDRYPTGSLFYYNGYLYIFCLDDDYNAIERISLDGLTREISCKLFRTIVEKTAEDDGYSVKIDYPEVTMHRGYVFYSTYYPGCEECGLYYVKLDSSDEPTEILTVSGEQPWVYRMKGYGGYLYFQQGQYIYDDDYYDISIYSYDIDTGEILLCVPEAIREYTVNGDDVYYCDMYDNIYRYQISMQSSSLFLENDSPGSNFLFFVKDEFFYKNVMTYVDWTGSVTQYVYDLDGNFIETHGGDDIIHAYVD